MSEEELYRVIDDSGFFKKLGYRKFGVDVKPQYPIPGERKKPDYVCRDDYQNVIFVIEAKKPFDKKLKDALAQLWDRYVLPLKAGYGVLTNGLRIVAYKRIGINQEQILDIELQKVSDNQCDLIYRALRKPEYDITDHTGIQRYFASVEKLSLKTDLAKENFFETFKLGEDSVFGSLVRQLTDLFGWLHPKSRFLRGAYGFWEKSLARKPEKIPESWKPFLKNDKEVYKLMFCLETAHALLARLILAKACEDLEFPGISISGFAIQKIQHLRGNIPLVAYPIVLMKLLKEMGYHLVFSVFEEDIFSWWDDAFTGFSDKPSGELLRERADGILEGFSRVIAKLVFVLYKFDFSEVAGDPLGDLYQQYFDKDTRKALGEFYTPVDVVNYILDAVHYTPGRFLTRKRLLDPACGSGTFIVEALKRYLKEAKSIAKEKGWAFVLQELCNSPRIVGLDIHPFACLISQVRFMLEIIPYYKEALREERAIAYTLERVPIFRTDSLAIEMMPEEFRKKPALVVTEEDIKFTAILPMRVNSEKFVSVDVAMPSWRKAASGTQHMLYNLDEYFCAAQAIFDAVKERARAKTEEVQINILQTFLRYYLKDKDFQLFAEFYKPYADSILREIRHLESEFEDGRLVKSIEDAVLAALLKNYLYYDFVVGNPPYVRVQRLPATLKEYYREHYKSAFGSFDIYVLFIERGISWLSKNGKLGYIVSGQFMVTDYGKEIKHLIINSSKILQIVDFSDSGVFSEVTNYPAIVILEKAENKNNRDRNTIKAVKVSKPMEKILEDVRTNFAKEKCSTDFYDLFEYPQADLTDEIWALMPQEEKRVFEKIEANATCRLKDIAADAFQGIRTSANEIYVVRVIRREGTDTKTGKDVAKVSPVNEDSEYPIEIDILKPFLKGEEIRRWKIDWGGLYLVHPYKLLRDGSGNITSARLYSTEEMQSEFPNAWKYFLERKRELEDREHARMRGNPDWYGYIYPKNLDKFERFKIISSDIANTNCFSIDSEGRWYFTAGYGILLRNALAKDYFNVLSLLNSKVVEFYFKHIGTVKSGGYYEYRPQYVEKLPVIIPKTRKQRELVSQIVNMTEEILRSLDPDRFIKKFPEAYFDKHIEGMEFDEIKYTFNAGHTKLAPILTGKQGQGYAVYPSKGEDPILVETEQKAHYVVLALTNRDVRQNDTVRILIPKDNAIVTEILDKFKSIMRQIGKTPIERLEKEINQLVYELYGLDDQDRKIVENFLEKT